MPTISIIVPVYNVENYVHRCIDSILNQTFSDFELILINDGSVDNSGKICDDYANKDNRITVMHQENTGQATARNRALDIIKGEYIFFVDSDDWIHPKTLETLLSLSVNTDSDIAACGFQKVDCFIDYFDLKDEKVEEYSSMNFYYYRSNLVNVPWCKLYRKCLFDNMRFPDGKIHEDVFLIYKIIYRAEKIAYIEYPFYYYFQNTDSTMLKKYSLKRLSEVEAGEEQVEFFKKRENDINYPQSLKRLMYYYSTHADQLKTLPEGKKYAKQLKRKLRRLLITKSRYCKVNISNSPFYYEVAFPKFMFLYWQIKRFFK